MTGKVRLILIDLLKGCSPEEISATWGIAPKTVTTLARKYGVQLKQSTKNSEEQRKRKRLRDKRRYRLKQQKNESIVVLNSFQAFKRGSLSSLDKSWILRQAENRSSFASNKYIQEKYGLKTARLA